LPKEIRTKLERELATPKYKAPGQKVVEEKSKTKERLGASPDLADGANLSFYEPKSPSRYEESDSASYTSQSY
jgi:hypothetical protein